MTEAISKTDHPGVNIPPPFIYILIFGISLGIQKIWPWSFVHSNPLRVLGWVMVAAGVLVSMSAILQFRRTGNNIVPIRSATSLQTGGIYSWTRNPMYTGLLLVYIGVGNVVGNWWTFVLIPILIWIVSGYVIRKEEGYLSRAFGEEYLRYKKNVRRWI
jgi:protein-S-isoprenylcysteine O-methyltransferase Ste14